MVDREKGSRGSDKERERERERRDRHGNGETRGGGEVSDSKY